MSNNLEGVSVYIDDENEPEREVTLWYMELLDPIDRAIIRAENRDAPAELDALKRMKEAVYQLAYGCHICGKDGGH